MKKNFLCITILLLIFFSSALCYAQDVEAPSMSASQNVEISSHAAILVDSNSGKILYEKNAYEKVYPASTTKILTAIVVLENCPLEDIVTISDYAVNSIPASYAGLTLEVGEELTVEQLLNLLLISSSNIAGNALAEHVSGSVDNFSILMNEKASLLGCQNSNFVNPYGLHNENHYTTAYDLSLISKYAMQNEVFRNIVAKSTYTLPPTNKTARTRTYKTTNELLRLPDSSDKTSFFYSNAIGIKTGFTGNAKECLVASSNKDSFEIISVVLGSETSELKYIDTIALFDFAYANYEYRELHDISIPISSVQISNATENTKNLDLYCENTISVLMEKSDINSIPAPTIVLNKDLKAPIQAGDVIGEVYYAVSDTEYRTNLIAGNNVEALSFWKQILKVIQGLFL